MSDGKKSSSGADKHHRVHSSSAVKLDSDGRKSAPMTDSSSLVAKGSESGMPKLEERVVIKAEHSSPGSKLQLAAVERKKKV